MKTLHSGVYREGANKHWDCFIPLTSPKIGSTETFLSIASFGTEKEAAPDKWKNVPFQDSMEFYDIDRSKSVREIDERLYKMYGLDEQEIDFIESYMDM